MKFLKDKRINNRKVVDVSGKSLRKYSDYKHFLFNFPITAPKDLIVICNFPFSRRSERDWFRYQLKGFNYSRLQKSVWVGPSPLPKEFLDYVKSIGLLNNLKILKLANPYSNK
jgi:DNA-binding transcriptional regulator PaaX